MQEDGDDVEGAELDRVLDVIDRIAVEDLAGMVGELDQRRDDPQQVELGAAPRPVQRRRLAGPGHRRPDSLGTNMPVAA